MMSSTKRILGDFSLVTVDSAGNIAGNVSFSTGNMELAGNLVVTGTSGSSAHPGYQANRYYTHEFSSLTPTALTADTLYVAPFYCAKKTTFTKMGFRLTTGVDTTNARIGVFNNTDGQPSTLHTDAGSQTTAIADVGARELTGLTITLNPGWYWLGVVSDGAPTINFQTGNAEIMNSIVGLTADNSTGFDSLSGSHTFGALPNTFPSVSYTNNSIVPHIWLRF